MKGLRGQPRVAAASSLLARDVRAVGWVAWVVVHTGGWWSVRCKFEGRPGEEYRVQRPSKASAAESGAGGRRGDERASDQGCRRPSAHEAPALGDLGDRLAHELGLCRGGYLHRRLIGEVRGGA